MIARTHPTWQPDNWQQELADGFRLPADLLAALEIAPDEIGVDFDSRNPFPLRVPLSYARRMRMRDPSDPLLRQVLPLAAERGGSPPGYSRDPVGDRDAFAAPGVLRKYRGRALLITTGACAIHCRYCFRRHFPYSESPRADGDWQAALGGLASDNTITEVILSGGDPLALTTRRLLHLINMIEAVPHITRLRIHTRLPIVLPARVNQSLVEMLAGSRLKAVMVVHANHPNEIDAGVREALFRLASSGIALFNQSVLLRGVNDVAPTLIRLSELLFESGVTPYYLHLLDRVEGAAHFEVDIDTARALHREMRETLPGYLVPRLVREEPGAPGKVPL